jgi:hypothetical protein
MTNDSPLPPDDQVPPPNDLRFKFVLSDDQVIYAVKPTGELLWYQHDPDPDPDRWDPNSGSQIGIGWDEFVHVFSGGDGVIYAIKPTGELMWYQDTLRNGTNGANAEQGWAANSGSQIGYGWDEFVHVFSGGDGVIYAITPTGELLWYQDTLRDGTNGPDAEQGWAANSGSQIGYGWDEFVHVFSAGNGIMYGVQIYNSGGNVHWYRDLLRNGANGPDASQGWDPGSGTKILDAPSDPRNPGQPRPGWQIIPIEGYCWPLSAKLGESIEFFVSSVLEQPYSVTYVRMKESPDGGYGIPVSDPFTMPGGYQSSFDLSWRDGCNWDPSFSLLVPEEWPSGFYAAKCETVTHSTYYVVFVVKPKPDEHKGLLVLANTNTWNAYNSWGGNSNYSFIDEKTLSYARPNLHLLNGPQDHPRGNHMLRGEIWFLDWLDASGYEYDLFTDVDFHRGIENLQSYKAVILSTHPEYWSTTMQDSLQDYLNEGGKLLYLGGNGMYRIVDFLLDPDHSERDCIAFNISSFEDTELFRNNGRSERRIFGVGYDEYGTYSSYIVRNLHRFFLGTGLSKGDPMGLNGRNGQASGWEVGYTRPDDPSKTDKVPEEDPDRSPLNTIVLAERSDNQRGNMVYREVDNGNGGFVFSVGSICFVGSLVEDENLQVIVRNVLNECLGG